MSREELPHAFAADRPVAAPLLRRKASVKLDHKAHRSASLRVSFSSEEVHDVHNRHLWVGHDPNAPCKHRGEHAIH